MDRELSRPAAQGQAEARGEPAAPGPADTGGTASERGTSSELTGKALTRAYDNALRMLDRDAEILDQQRTRANILLAALAIGGAVLGAILPSLQAHQHLPVVLVVLLGVAIAACVSIQWPVRDHGKLTQASGKKPRNYWARFIAPWKELIDAAGNNQRLWKTGLGECDLKKAQTSADGGEIDRELIRIMYDAHARNNGTLSRRADLLRLASILVLVFVISLAVWLRLLGVS